MRNSATIMNQSKIAKVDYTLEIFIQNFEYLNVSNGFLIWYFNIWNFPNTCEISNVALEVQLINLLHCSSHVVWVFYRKHVQTRSKLRIVWGHCQVWITFFFFYSYYQFFCLKLVECSLTKIFFTNFFG